MYDQKISEEYLMARLQVTETQVKMAYYSGAIPLTIDPEPFIQHWEALLKKQRARKQLNETAPDGLQMQCADLCVAYIDRR